MSCSSSIVQKKDNKIAHYLALLSIGIVPFHSCLEQNDSIVRRAAEESCIDWETKEKTCLRLQEGGLHDFDFSKMQDSNYLPPLVASEQNEYNSTTYADETENKATSSLLMPVGKDAPYFARRVDSLLTSVIPTSPLFANDKNRVLKERFSWPDARSLDKDVRFMCWEFFNESSPLFPQKFGNQRTDLLYKLASVFYGKKELAEAVEDDASNEFAQNAMIRLQGKNLSYDMKDEKVEKARDLTAILIHDVIVSSHGVKALNNTKEKELRRAARLCVLLSHPIIQNTLKRAGVVEHLDRATINSLRAIEKSEQEAFISKQISDRQTWSQWIEDKVSFGLAQIYNLANYAASYRDWKMQKKFLLRALKESKKVIEVGNKASNLIYGKPDRPNFDFYDYSNATK